MADKKKKASISQIKKLIQPYIKVHAFGKGTISQDQIKLVAQKILRVYSNVEISEGCFEGAGKPLMKIVVKGFLHTNIIFLEIKGFKGKTDKKNINHWVDDVEAYLAAVED